MFFVSGVLHSMPTQTFDSLYRRMSRHYSIVILISQHIKSAESSQHLGRVTSRSIHKSQQSGSIQSHPAVTLFCHPPKPNSSFVRWIACGTRAGPAGVGSRVPPLSLRRLPGDRSVVGLRSVWSAVCRVCRLCRVGSVWSV